MTLSLEDIDCKLGALQITIQDNLVRLEELETARERVIEKFHRQLHGFVSKKTYCLCSYQKIEGNLEFVINPKCPSHNKN